MVLEWLLERFIPPYEWGNHRWSPGPEHAGFLIPEGAYVLSHVVPRYNADGREIEQHRLSIISPLDEILYEAKLDTELLVEGHDNELSYMPAFIIGFHEGRFAVGADIRDGTIIFRDKNAFRTSIENNLGLQPGVFSRYFSRSNLPEMILEKIYDIL